MTIAFPSEETKATTAPSTAPTNRITEIADPETSEISNPEISNSDLTNPPPRKLPLSEKRLAANRANAKKSTGPRTQQGKQTVSKNATTHALTATPDPTNFQDPNYSSRLYELTKEFRPQSPSQTYLVEQLALIGHKLDQIPQIESHLLAQAAATLQTSTSDIPTVQSSTFDVQCSMFSDSSPLKSEIPNLKSPSPNLPSLIAHELQKDKPTPVTRLYDLQRRLQSRFQSIIRQIHQLQKHQTTQRTQTLNQQPTREDQDHDALTEELNRIHEQNKQRDQSARLQRHREQDNSPAQNKPTPTTDPMSPAEPLQQSLAVSRIENPGAQNKPTPTSNSTPLAEPPQQLLAVSRIENPISQIKPTDPPVTSTPTPASNPSSNTTQIGDLQ